MGIAAGMLKLILLPCLDMLSFSELNRIWLVSIDTFSLSRVPFMLLDKSFTAR